MKLKFILASLILSCCLLQADAQAVRSVTQHKRIKQGVRSGELTRAEAINLRHGQREIRQEKKEARADGVVTPGERQEIRQDQNQHSRKILRKKHNRRGRG